MDPGPGARLDELAPAGTPVIAGLEIARRRAPGAGGWCDVLALPDGRAAVIAGHAGAGSRGADAPAERMRVAFGAYALASASPADAVARMDRLAAAEPPPGPVALLAVYLDPRTGAARACCAGHRPPLLVDGHGAVALAVAAGPPLGAGLPVRREAGLRLELGATLAVCAGAADPGTDERLRAAAESGAGARALTGRLAVAADAGADAIVALTRVAARLQRRFPAVAAAVAAARRDVTGFAAACGIHASVIADVGLAVSEACTNVVMHAYRGMAPGPMDVTARIDERGLEVTVRDRGGGVRPRPDSPGIGLGLRIIARTTEAHAVRDAPGGGAQLVLRFPARPTMTA